MGGACSCKQEAAELEAANRKRAEDEAHVRKQVELEPANREQAEVEAHIRKQVELEPANRKREGEDLNWRLNRGSWLGMKLQIRERQAEEEDEAKSQKITEEEAAYLQQQQKAELEANP